MRKVKYFLITGFMLVLFTNAIANCNIDTIYTYFDAARNKYVLTANALEYVPINTRESSSGIYNGGTYESKLLTEKQCKKLIQLFNAALVDKKAQTNKNTKPNAAIEINIGKKKIDFLLKSTSVINISINNCLKELIKN